MCGSWGYEMRSVTVLAGVAGRSACVIRACGGALRRKGSKGLQGARLVWTGGMMADVWEGHARIVEAIMEHYTN
jgi:hypothetical protein